MGPGCGRVGAGVVCAVMFLVVTGLTCDRRRRCDTSGFITGYPGRVFVKTVLRTGDVGRSACGFLGVSVGPVGVKCAVPVGSRAVAPSCGGVVGTVRRTLGAGSILGDGCSFSFMVGGVGSCRRLTIG